MDAAESRRGQIFCDDELGYRARDFLQRPRGRVLLASLAALRDPLHFEAEVFTGRFRLPVSHLVLGTLAPDRVRTPLLGRTLSRQRLGDSCRTRRILGDYPL